VTNTTGDAEATRTRVMAVCAAQQGAVLTQPFGDGVGVYKVGGKMFALCGLLDDPMRITLKGEPDRVVALVREHACVEPGFHMNKRYWVTIKLDGELPHTLVTELVEDSYDLVVDSLPKRLRPPRP
jgi:predicted DNA-binding protein (MmcQ/YjbR family)